MHSVKQQYERFPYPPISSLALPHRDQGKGLRYERAVELVKAAGLTAIEPANHHGLRILVAGAGTLEPLVVAQQHLKAKEIVAVDLSRRSLSRLRRRLVLGRARELLRFHLLPPIKLIEADITEWSDEGGFDYIIASNMLHHTDDPAQTLHHLASMLKPGGVMRIVTYAKQSRFWINMTSEWLRWHGLNAETLRLKQKARKVIKLLPEEHPIRSCFNAHNETRSTAGLVDAFFHSCETPLSPLQWQQATESAGLQWLGETQSELAQGKFMLELEPKTAALTPWQRLQLLDDLLELNTSPILWFCKRDSEKCAVADIPVAAVNNLAVDITKTRWSLPSQIYWQLGQRLRYADALLQSARSGVLPLIARLREEVGPRLDRKNRLLPGLTLSEYPVETLLAAIEPPHLEQWQQLEESAGRCRIEYWNGDAIPGVTLGAQEQWLQLRYGYKHGWIGPLATKMYVDQ